MDAASRADLPARVRSGDSAEARDALPRQPQTRGNAARGSRTRAPWEDGLCATVMGSFTGLTLKPIVIPLMRLDVIAPMMTPLVAPSDLAPRSLLKDARVGTGEVIKETPSPS